LTPEVRRVLRKLFHHAPQLKQAFTLRQQLTTIFDQDLPKAVGHRKIRNWIGRVRRSGLKCFDQFL
jgi:hypothetical protein